MTAGTDVARAAKQAGFPDSELVTAVAVAFAESGWNANATNANRDGTTDYGLWQINSVHAFPEIQSGAWRDPLANARMAYTVWRKSGWNAWSVHKQSNPTGYARYVAAIPAATAMVAAGVGVGAGVVGAIGVPGDVASSAVGTAADAHNLAATIAKEPLAVLKWLQDPQTWFRITRFVVGGVLIVTGVYIFATSSLAKPVVSGAKKIAGKGK